MNRDRPASAGDPPRGGGPDVALGELGRAITRAADALAALPAHDVASAYRCARALDAAFTDLADLLQAVPGIVGLGDPGRKVSERLEQHRTELAARRAEVAAFRAKLDDLEEITTSLAEETAEAESLRERIAELEDENELAQATNSPDAAESAAGYSQMISHLAAWTQADAEVADALQAVGSSTEDNALRIAQTELDGIRDRLIDLDGRLRTLLREQDAANEKALRARPL